MKNVANSGMPAGKIPVGLHETSEEAFEDQPIVPASHHPWSR